MDCINELRDSLNVHLGWNKARITCFVNRLLALLTVRTVNLNKLACVVIGEAQRMDQHQEGLVDGFIKKYDVHQLLEFGRGVTKKLFRRLISSQINWIHVNTPTQTTGDFRLLHNLP